MQADGAARRRAPLTSKLSSSLKQDADNEQHVQQVVKTDNSQPQAAAIATLVTQSVNALAEPVKRTLASPALKKAVLGSALLALLVVLSLSTAILAYAVFYYLYVPNVGFTKEVLLNYGHTKTPFASVDLARAGIASDLVYDVILHLIVPASPRNMDLGNFMVDVAFQSSNGDTVKQAARAASLTWTPPLVRSIQTLLRLPAFLLWNSYSHTQHLRVPLLTKASLRTFTSPKIAQALVQVGRGDLTSELAVSSSQGSASAAELHVYSASLEIVTHLSGLRWLMYHHRIISFLLFCSTFFFVSLVSALLLWAVAGYTLNSQATIEAVETSSENKLDEAEEVHDDAASVKTEDTESEWEAPTPLKPLARTPSSASSSQTGKGKTAQRSDATRQELEDQARRLAQIRAKGGDFLHSESDSGEERKPGMLAHIDFASADVPAKGSSKLSRQQQEEEDTVLVRPKGSSSEESSSQSSPKWENVSPQGEDATSVVVKKEDEAGFDEQDASSSVGTAKTHSTARQAQDAALRRRPSSRSLKEAQAD